MKHANAFQVWWQRQRYFMDYSVAALRRHRAKTIGLWLVYTVLVFVLASFTLLGTALRKEVAATLENAPDLVVQAMRMGRHEWVTSTDLEKLRGIRGTDRAEGRLWGYLYDTASAATYTLQVPSTHADFAGPAIGEVIVGEGVARLRKVQEGQPLFLVAPAGRFFKFQVKAVLPTESALFTSDVVLLSESDFRAFFNLTDNQYTDFALRVRNPKEVTKVTEKLSLLLPGYRFIARADLQRTYESLFSWREGLLLAAMAGALLAFAILAFDKASGLSAQERREIGILKAIGWETSEVMHMKLWEAGFVSVSAFLMGFILAYLHVFGMGATLFEPVLRGWTTLFPRLSLPPTVDGLQITTLGSLVIAPYLAAVLVPLWQAASTDPDQVMR